MFEPTDALDASSGGNRDLSKAKSIDLTDTGETKPTSLAAQALAPFSATTRRQGCHDACKSRLDFLSLPHVIA